MRRFWFGLLSVIILAAAPTVGALAARDFLPGFLSGGPLAKSEPRATLELIAFEIEGCHYCELFRRDILPRYQAAPQAQRAPLRMIDLNRIDAETLALKDGVRMVPTVVLMRDGREFDRISGVVSLESFFKMVQYMLDRVD